MIQPYQSCTRFNPSMQHYLLSIQQFLLYVFLCVQTLSWFQVLTKDSVTVSVDGVVYYRVQNATLAVANITNADAATRLLAQTTLRNVLGTKNLAEILSDREEIAHNMQVEYSSCYTYC